MTTMTTMTLRKLTAEDVTVTLSIEPEEVSHRGLEWEVENAFPGDPNGPAEDVEADVKMRAEICRRVRAGDDWAFGTVVVTVEWHGLEGTDSLGHCSYADEADFRKCDDYYTSMVDQALEDINSKLAATYALVSPLVSAESAVDPAAAPVPGDGG